MFRAPASGAALHDAPSRGPRLSERLLANARIRHTPDRLMEAWALYRIALLLALLGLLLSPLDIALPDSPIVRLLILTNVGVAVLVLVINRLRLLPVFGLAAAQLGQDFGIATGVVFLAGGMAGGLSSMFIVPVALGALFLPRYAALLPAAIASLILLTIEYRLQLDHIDFNASWAPAGLLGAFLFLVALVANTLAIRARLDEQVARLAATSLGQMRQLAAQVVERMQAAVLVTDMQGHVLLGNAASQRLLMHRFDQRPLEQREPALWQAALQQIIRPTLAEAEPVPLSQGQAVWPQVRRLSGDPPLLLIVVDDPDFTRRQRQQARLAAIGQITAGVAHDIRNPLAAISNAAQLLEEASAEERATLIGILQRQSQRLNRVVERIHDLARPVQPQPTAVALQPWLQQWRDDYLRSAATPVAITVQAANDLHCRVDPHHLAEILDNLVDNAAQHARPAATSVVVVHVGAEPGDTDAETVVIGVVDNGEHPLDAGSDKPFEAFTGEGRMGLGLTLCRELAEANRGYIRLCRRRKAPLPGTCFALEFPRAGGPT